MNRKIKITEDSITYGPRSFDLDDVTAFTYAGDLTSKGYRRTNNAYCMVSRIDRDDWLDILARDMKCCVADFYNKDGSGVSDRWRDYYIRTYSKDTLTVSPAIHQRMKSY